MPLLRARNAALLLVLEASEGVFQAPSASTDGILVEEPSINFNPQNVETNEVTGSLDGRGPIVGGLQCELGFSAYLKGSGIPGVAPEWGDALKVCGWGESVTLTSVTGTTYSITGTNSVNDTGSGLAAFTIGTVLHMSGWANAGNAGEFIVTAAAAGALTLAKPDGSAPGLTNETAGASVTLRRGVAAIAATAGSQTGFTAQAPWSNTDQAYRGMPVLLSGNPAIPAWAFLADYSAARVAGLADLFQSALSVSTKASIPAHLLYRPVSTGIPSASAEFYLDGVRYQFSGLRGTVSFEAQAAGPAKASFQLSGLFVAKSDAAMPSVSYDGTRPGVFRNSKMLVNRQLAALQSLSLDSGNNLVFPENPNVAEGFDPPLIVERKLAGAMNPFATLIATRDIMGDFRVGTERILHARIMGGPATQPGNRIGLTIPAAFYTGHQPRNRNGLATEETQFFPRGQDSGAYLAIW